MADVVLMNPLVFGYLSSPWPPRALQDVVVMQKLKKQRLDGSQIWPHDQHHFVLHPS